jgi:hypothetical protein
MPKLNQGDLPLPAGGPRAPEFQKQRDPSGRFLPAGKQATQEPAAAAPAAPSAQSPSVPGQEAPVGQKTYAPPPGWTATAKAEFGKLPPVVQEAVAKREEEINNGFKKLQTYKGLDEYIETAARAGTTVPEALDRYMQSEALLERDPIRGLLWLCETYNVDPRQLIQGGQPHQQQTYQGQPNPYVPQQFDFQRFVQPVAQEVNQLKQMLAQERQNKISEDINAFASDPKNQYFENVADQMAMIISAGSTAPLNEIYEQACYMNPEVRGLLIREQTAKAQADQVAKARQVAAQARQAGNSVTGGTGSPAPAGSPNLSLRDEISGHFYGNRA